MLVSLGIAIRVIMRMNHRPKPALRSRQPLPKRCPEEAGGASSAFNPLRLVVFAIWALVTVMAFLGVVKPF